MKKLIILLLLTLPVMAQERHFATKELDNTFTGKNTFTQPVTVPTPSTATDAVNKGYVDSHGGDLSTPAPIGNTTPNTAVFTDLTTKNTPVLDIRAYNNDWQTAVNACPTGGCEIDIPPGTYTIPTAPVLIGDNSNIKTVCKGVSGWGADTTHEACRFLATTPGQPLVHIVSSLGASHLMHAGPIFDGLTLVDNSNAGAGGLTAGGILAEGVNRGTINKVNFDGFTGAGAYAIKIDGSAGGDSSYWLITSPFARGNTNGIILKQGAATIIGGEIGATSGGVGLDLQTNSATVNVFGTSIEVTSGATCVKVDGWQHNLFPRCEAVTGSTNVIGVEFLPTSRHNFLGGSINKFTTGVQFDAGATTNQAMPTFENNTTNVVDMTNNSGNWVCSATAGQCDAQTNWGGQLGGWSMSPSPEPGTGANLRGKMVTPLNAGLGIIEGVGLVQASAASRSGSSTVSITSASPHGLATGNVISVNGCSVAAYNTTSSVTVTDTTHFTYTATGSGTDSATRCQFNRTGGLYLQADNPALGMIGAGFYGNTNEYNQYATATKGAKINFSDDSMTFKTFSAGTLGSAVGPSGWTTRMTLSSSGVSFGTPPTLTDPTGQGGVQTALYSYDLAASMSKTLTISVVNNTSGRQVLFEVDVANEGYTKEYTRYLAVGYVGGTAALWRMNGGTSYATSLPRVIAGNITTNSGASTVSFDLANLEAQHNYGTLRFTFYQIGGSNWVQSIAEGAAFATTMTVPTYMDGYFNTVSVNGNQVVANTGKIVTSSLPSYEVSFNWELPSTTDSGKFQTHYSNAATITRVYCSTDTGTVTINLEKRTEAGPNSAGTSVLTSDLVCAATGASTTSFASAAISSNTLLTPIVVSTNSSPTLVRIHVQAQP